MQARISEIHFPKLDAKVTTAVAKSELQTTQSVAPNGVLRFVIVRQGGVSASRFDRLRFERTLPLIDRLLQLEDRCRQEATAISDLLERVIGASQSPSVNGELIRLRRDIYNDRMPQRDLSPDAHAAITTALSPLQLDQLFEWIARRQVREHLAGEGETLFAGELEQARAVLKHLVRNRAFRRGLPLASPALSRELDRYIRAASRDDLHRPHRIESALVRYYTRCAFKLSPFSSFMRTGLIDLSDGSLNPSSDSVRPRRRIRRSVKLNRALLGYLAQRIALHPELKDDVPVFRGTVVSPEGDRLQVLRRRYRDGMPVRMRIPQEVVVALPQGSGLKWVTTYLESCGGSARRRDLIAALSQSANDGERAAAFVDKLVELGVLAHKIPAGEDSDEVKTLARFLSNIPSPVADAVRHSLETLVALEHQFEIAEYDKREGLLAQMETALKNAFIPLGADLDSGWNGPIVYEDCVEEPILTAELKDEWKPALIDLRNFLGSYGALLDGNIVFRETMRHVLRSEYGGGPVRFLQLADRCKKGPIGDQAGDPWKWNTSTPNPFDLESLDHLATLRSEFGDIIARPSDEDEVDLKALAESYQWPERVQQLDLASVSGDIFCLSCHCQPVSLPGRPAALVLNMLNNGPARALLRCGAALHDPQIQAQLISDIRTTLSQLWPHLEPCELIAPFDYNANLHPRVTEWAITYDDSPRANAKDITLEELVIKVGPRGRLVLVHAPSGRPILPLDLGMMASALKPLMQHFLLSIGNLDAMLHKKPFHPYYWSSPGRQREAVETYSRLIFNRCIVRRRGWSLAPEELPARQPNDSNFQYSMRVRRWQQKLGLPDEVFVCSEFSRGVTQQHQNSRQSWNRRKPQYIHFGNHFLIEILGKLIGELETRLYVEEMLPDRVSWDRWGLHRPAEFVLDVCADYYAGRGHALQTEFSDLITVMHTTP